MSDSFRPSCDLLFFRPKTSWDGDSHLQLPSAYEPHDLKRGAAGTGERLEDDICVERNDHKLMIAYLLSSVQQLDVRSERSDGCEIRCRDRRADYLPREVG